MDKLALKESITDKIWGTVINFPLNWILIALCLEWQMTAFTMTVFITSVVFFFAVFRSYYIRLYFKRGEENA